MKKNGRQKHGNRAAVWTVSALLLCFFLLGGVLYFTRGQTPGEMPQGDNAGAGAASKEEPVSPPEPEPESAPPPPTTEELLMEYIQTMSLEEKVGQLFLIRCPEGKPVNGVRKFQPGGMIFFARDFAEKGPDEVQAEIASYQEVSSVPMLTAVDEEGGEVNRISRYSQYRAEPFASPQQLYASGGWERIAADTVEKCQLLASLGINVNMAPVCDMAADSSSYIYRRTFGAGPAKTSEYVRRVVTTMTEQNTGSVLKHFPGYGGNLDTLQVFSVDVRPYSKFESSDFLPFQAGIEAGAGAVLVSHNIVECMDAELPASLSPEVHRVLREELEFEGVIMTDDLVMQAITDAYGAEEAAVQAVKAGKDMLCCTNYKVQIPSVIAAVETGEISEARIEESVLRVLLWKHQLGLVEVSK